MFNTKTTKRGSILLFLVLSTQFLLTACTGEAGPMGPPGSQGSSGPPGQNGPSGPGTRTVYEGVVTNSPHTVWCQEVTLNDMPSISVMISTDADGTYWYEIPMTWLSYEYQYTEAYRATEGRVELFNCQGWRYKVIIVE